MSSVSKTGQVAFHPSVGGTADQVFRNHVVIAQELPNNHHSQRTPIFTTYFQAVQTKLDTPHVGIIVHHQPPQPHHESD